MRLLKNFLYRYSFTRRILIFRRLQSLTSGVKQ